MRKTIYILIFLGIGINFCFSQTESEKRFGLTKFDSIEHNRIYRVQIENYQVIELVDFKNGTFNGTLNNLVWKTNRKGIRKDSILQKITIPSSIVKKLILELKENGFENLKDCRKVKNCISGLDGTTTFFKSIDSRKTNSASYWELESDFYYNPDKVVIPTEVMKARKLISLVNKEFDMKKQFQNFLDRLPNGSYSYSMQIMKKG